MASSTVENYLKCLYVEAQSTPDGVVAMGRLASAMGVVPGTVTSMVKALADSGLVEYEPRSGAKLTPGGSQLALHVLRRHRLVELFLVKVLGLDWSEVHAEAEELEHAISDKVLQKIDALLEHPQVDPHGDPIPSAAGEMALHEKEDARQSLLDCAVGETLRIARVLDQNPVFLQFLDRQRLTPGTTITIASRDQQAAAVTVHPDGAPAVTLGTDAAAKILVHRK